MSDQRVEELSLRIDHLGAQVAALSEQLQRLTVVVENERPTTLSSYTLLSAGGSEASASGGVGSRSVSSVGDGDYNTLALEIPALPDRLLHSCSRLSGGKFSYRARAERAWESGYWARLWLAERISKPRPSKPCDLPNCIYVVLRCEGYPVPLFVTKAADYRFILGDFRSNTLSHGFASRAEAEVYSEAAGVSLPRWQYQLQL